MASSSPPPTPSSPHNHNAVHPPLPRSPLETQNVTKLESQLTALETKIAILESQIADTEAQEAEIRGKLSSPTPPSQTVQTHIRLLHTYNDTRDMATGLMGIIAENRGVRARDVYEEFGVEEGS